MCTGISSWTQPSLTPGLFHHWNPSALLHAFTAGHNSCAERAHKYNPAQVKSSRCPALCAPVWLLLALCKKGRDCAEKGVMTEVQKNKKNGLS